MYDTGGLTRSKLLGAILGPIATIVAAVIAGIFGLIIKRNRYEARANPNSDLQQLLECKFTTIV